MQILYIGENQTIENTSRRLTCAGSPSLLFSFEIDSSGQTSDCVWVDSSGFRKAFRIWIRQQKIPESNRDCLSTGCRFENNTVRISSMQPSKFSRAGVRQLSVVLGTSYQWNTCIQTELFIVYYTNTTRKISGRQLFTHWILTLSPGKGESRDPEENGKAKGMGSNNDLV